MCYEYLDSIKKLEEEQLPDTQHFYSKLNQEHIADDAYMHVQAVWEAFKCVYATTRCCTYISTYFFNLRQ